MKKALFVLLGLLAAAVVYLWYSNPLNALVQGAIEKWGSEMIQAPVRVGRVDLSPSDGRGTLSDLSLGNPQGFKGEQAFRVERIEVALEPSSLTKDVVVVHKIAIDAPQIAYEKNDGGTNFEAIQRNVERYLGTQKTEAGKPEKKMLIESLSIRNAKVNYNGLIDLNLPDIELRNIGKKSGGATSAQVVSAIVTELNTKLAIALAKTVAVGAVGGVAVGIGMGLQSLLGK